MSFDDLLPDTVFSGDIEKQFFGILQASDPYAAQNEINALIDRAGKLEAFLQQKGLLEEAESAAFEEAEIKTLRHNYMIGAMARVVSSHER